MANNSGLSLLALALWLYGSGMLLMVILQFVQADYHNKAVQVLIKITMPVLRPLQRILPSGSRLNTAALVLTILLFVAAVALTFFSLIGVLPPLGIALVSTRLLVATVLDIFTASLIIHALMSWFGPQSYFSPTGRLLGSINEPLVAPIRNLIGAKLGGMDFSYLIVILLIYGLRSLLGLTFLAGFNLKIMVAQAMSAGTL